MRPSSCKAKGAALQKRVRDMLLKNAPELTLDDVRSTSMGAGGEDVQLSPKAREVYPIGIECKNLAKVAIYTHYQQAAAHGTHEPVLVVKQNHCKPLAIVDADYFFKMMAEWSEGKKE